MPSLDSIKKLFLRFSCCYLHNWVYSEIDNEELEKMLPSWHKELQKFSDNEIHLAFDLLIDPEGKYVSYPPTLLEFVTVCHRTRKVILSPRARHSLGIGEYSRCLHVHDSDTAVL